MRKQACSWGDAEGTAVFQAHVLSPEYQIYTRNPYRINSSPSHNVVWTDDHFGNFRNVLVLAENKMVAASHISLPQHIYKCFCGRGSAQDPTREAYSAPTPSW